MLYHCTLKLGRVVSMTLALIVQREAEIDDFKPEPLYTAEPDTGVLIVLKKFKEESWAKVLDVACEGSPPPSQA